MKKIVISLVSAVVMASGANCTLSTMGSVDVTWKAFKTPAKIGVGGNFKQVGFTTKVNQAHNFKKLLVGAKATIDATSVFSNHAARDVKLVNFFFNQMQSNTIEASIVDIISDKIEKGKPKTGIAKVMIVMNGVKKEVPMRFSYSDGTLVANGYIDLFDFQASKALSSINKACFEKHQGKTWSDVAIGFRMPIKAVCNR